MQPLEREGIRLAATVMLIRDTAPDREEGIEVYMVQRPGGEVFPDLHVFPGGKVDEGDWAPDICDTIDDVEASRDLGVEAGGLRYWVAVARECFEECGVLLARQEGAMIDFDEPQNEVRFEKYRADLLADRITFADICHSENLTVACDLLAYFSHWITPEMAPRRFDTRFFLAAMPADQDTLAHDDEVAGDHWVSPQEALGHFERGEWQMIDPTLRSLETLSRFKTIGDALAGVRGGNHLMPLTPELNRQGMQPLR